RTSARADSSSAEQPGQARTCALSGAVPKPTSPSSSWSISSGSRCLSTNPPGVLTIGAQDLFHGSGGAATAVSGSSGSFPQVRQRVAEGVSGAMDVGLHGAQRQVERGGDLLVRTPLHVPQQDARAVFRAEPGNGLLDRAPQLARFDLLERGFVRRAHVEGRR